MPKQTSPRTYTQKVAYESGRRLARFRTPSIAARMSLGDPIRDWLTAEERLIMRASHGREWSRWWWKGYLDERGNP